MTADRVGTSSGFLKIPNSYPATPDEHAANMRELERVVNEIPLASQGGVTLGSQITASEGASANDTVETEALPAGYWMVAGSALVTWANPDTGYVSGYLSNANGVEISLVVTGDTGATSTIIFPGYPYVSAGNATTDRIRFNPGVSGSGPADTWSYQVTCTFIAPSVEA